MKIVLDLQSLQTESRFRGIGRYSMSLARAMITEGRKHEFNIILNHYFPDTIDKIKKDFEDLLPSENILVFSVPRVAFGFDKGSQRQYKSAELVREHFVEQLKPDFVHVSSLFEGMDNSVSSINAFNQISTAVTLYDLIPFTHQKIYLENPLIKSHYMNQLNYLQRSELILAISESTRREAIEVLGIPKEHIINISSAVDAGFQKLNLNEETVRRIMERYHVTRDMVMYTGGIEYRKNIEGLIEAYAGLSAEIRSHYQLVICCKVLEEERKRLAGFASKQGLAKDELVLTGYVSDADLIAFYNLCKLFVFPSLYEGFGLPVLEAMCCGAPVIGSKSTSIPEIIGFEEALFDPTSAASISQKIHQVLTNDLFLQQLRQNGQVQASKFSWKYSAQRALEAMEVTHDRSQHSSRSMTQVSTIPQKPHLAFISPLSPEKSGIADYSTELLPELSKFYDIDLVTELKEVSDPWMNANLKRKSVADFEIQVEQYDRILYQFGNSAFHSHMFNLLQKYPGTVVLHDFFLSGVLRYMENATHNSNIFQEALYRSHGYPALLYLRDQGVDKAIMAYPCSKEVFEAAQGVIMHSEHGLKLAKQFYSINNAVHTVRIPHLRRLPGRIDRIVARRALELSEETLIVCSFGIIHSNKLNENLLNAWLTSTLSQVNECQLIFVGEGFGAAYEQSLRKIIKDNGVSRQVKITGYVDTEQYQQYLAAADVAVQLRTNSRGETSGTVFDCFAHGLATIVNNHGWLSELPNDSVIKIPDKFTISELAQALEQLYHDSTKREMLGNIAINYVKNNLDPQQIARQYYEAIESFTRNHPVATQRRLISKVTALAANFLPGDQELAEISVAISENTIYEGIHQLLVDISMMVRDDLKTDIPKVSCDILNQLVKGTPVGFRIEPIYYENGICRYARKFMQGFLNIPDSGLTDAPVDIRPGDIYLGIDPDTKAKEASFQWLRYHSQRGLKIYYVLYDLLPIVHPEWFSPDIYSSCKNWINGISSISDSLIGISHSTAEEVGNWLNSHPVERLKPLHIDYFYLGADIEASKPTNGLPSSEKTIIDQISNQTNILMVGTVEPRKGYRQALKAFEQLWSKNDRTNLVIVGKQGWNVEDLIKRLKSHPLKDKHLFWFDKASDELLLNIYQKASALLMASEGEGFGLPLLEAAKHGLPIIARDLPVFREVAGNNAFYFNGKDAGSLALALDEWLDLYKRNKHPNSQGIKLLTWAESAKQLKEVLFSPVSRASWDSQNGFRWNSESFNNSP